jgi:hypothetical protein
MFLKKKIHASNRKAQASTQGGLFFFLLSLRGGGEGTRIFSFSLFPIVLFEFPMGFY